MENDALTRGLVSCGCHFLLLSICVATSVALCSKRLDGGESNPLYCLKLVFLVIRGCSLAASFLTSLLFHVTVIRYYSLALLHL